MIFEHDNYRTFMKGVLTQRMVENSSYSLRAFARDIGVVPSMLSQVLSGKRQLSLQRSAEIGQKLNLTLEEQEYFSLLVQWETCRDMEMRLHLWDRMKAFRKKRQVSHVGLEAFRVLSNWYHIPILAMTDLEGVQIHPQTVSRYLGIKPIEAEDAIDRLLRLELLIKGEDGRLVRAKQHPIFQSEEVSLGLRQFHKVMIEKALKSVDTQDPSEKFIGSETLAIHPEDLKKAKQMINQFLDRLVNTLGQGKTKTEIYHIGVQFFNLNGDKL